MIGRLARLTDAFLNHGAVGRKNWRTPAAVATFSVDADLGG